MMGNFRRRRRRLHVLSQFFCASPWNDDAGDDTEACPHARNHDAGGDAEACPAGPLHSLRAKRRTSVADVLDRSKLEEVNN